MRRILVATVALGLVAGLVAAPATAAKKKKKKAKPVATTLYFHGVAPLGEADGVQWFADGAGKPLGTLDGTEPSDPQPKSQALGNPALNTNCTGLPLGFPTFQGDLAGTIVGDVKVFANMASPPGVVTARIWADVPAFSCNDGYIAPAQEVEVQVPAGQNEVEIVFEDLNLPTSNWILVELLGSGATYPGRFLYDSTSAPSRIEFSCVPATGSSCTP